MILIMERMDRRWSALTREDVQLLADSTPVERYNSTGLAKGEYTPALSDKLKGKKIKILFEKEECYYYDFVQTNQLVWSADEKGLHKEYCQVLEAPEEEDIFLVQHYCKESVPPAAHTLVLDFKTGLVTLCIAKAGVPQAAREIGRTFLFGIMEGYEEYGYRHDFTEDLVGKSIYWTYIEKENLKIKHIYTAPLYYTYVMTKPDGTCWVASNPANYVKINDHMYVFSFIEERQAGTQGFFLINMKTLHDVGSFFGIHAHGMECCTFGAKGELSSPYAWELCKVKKEE